MSGSRAPGSGREGNNGMKHAKIMKILRIISVPAMLFALAVLFWITGVFFRHNDFKAEIQSGVSSGAAVSLPSAAAVPAPASPSANELIPPEKPGMNFR